nr:ACT domain-containing protein ACR11-like [Tanacetum cinerariifolium]
MIAALYDDISITAHVHRTRELLSLSTLHSLSSTSLALQHESNQNAASKSGDLLLIKFSRNDRSNFVPPSRPGRTLLLSNHAIFVSGCMHIYAVVIALFKLEVDITTRIHIDDDSLDKSLLSVETADRPGLLVDLLKIVTDISVAVESGEYDTE